MRASTARLNAAASAIVAKVFCARSPVDPNSRTANREARVVLTRDVALLKRSLVRHGHWVRHTDPERQLAEVLDRFDLVDRMAPFSRCLRCNTPLVAADADAIADRLLPRTRAGFREFRRCPGCGRIYWQGSHYEPLRRVLPRAAGEDARLPG